MLGFCVGKFNVKINVVVSPILGIKLVLELESIELKNIKSKSCRSIGDPTRVHCISKKTIPEKFDHRPINDRYPFKRAIQEAEKLSSRELWSQGS